MKEQQTVTTEPADKDPQENVIELTEWNMLGILSLMIVPLLLVWWFRLGLLWPLIWGTVRMCVQLFLIGLYLFLLFDLNLAWVTGLWMLIMMAVSNGMTLYRSGLVYRRFVAVTFSSTFLVALSVALFFVVGIIRPDPWLDARYAIPIYGMILGNTMNANIVALERFYRGIQVKEDEFMTRQMLGATLSEAAHPYFTTAIRAAINPLLATMGTIGIVSLPGMMTGQILGGSPVMTAVKYQTAIMVCIMVVMVTGTIATVRLSYRIAFDEYGHLRRNIFR